MAFQKHRPANKSSMPADYYPEQLRNKLPEIRGPSGVASQKSSCFRHPNTMGDKTFAFLWESHIDVLSFGLHTGPFD